MTKEEKILVIEDTIRIMENLKKILKSELDELKSVHKDDADNPQITNQPKEVVISDVKTEKTSMDEIKIYGLLKELGMPLNILGYRYIKIAIMLSIENPKMLEQMTTQLYPTVAKMVQSTKSRVERAIRHAVEKTWDYGNLDKLYQVFGHSYSQNRGKTTNSEFIAGIITYLSYQNC